MAFNLGKHGDKITIDMEMLIGGDIVPVQLNINRGVLSIRVKGQRKRHLMAEWTHIISKIPVPNEAPGKYLSRSVAFMKGD